MTAQIIDGSAISKTIIEELKQEVARLKEDHGVVPCLVTILVGNDSASQVYVRSKIKMCNYLGILSKQIDLPEETSEEELLKVIKQLNVDPSIHGILVQVPLPKHIKENKVLFAIDPDKDVDGFHPTNVGRMVIGEPVFLPCTPHGVQVLLQRSNIETKGAHVVVVGRSNIVGKPVANIMVQKALGANATVTICHSATKDIASITRQADILIVAMGKPKYITADMVKDGVVVIDVGVNQIGISPAGKRILCGDVDFENVKEKASYITPVPGGVGPMTIAMLMDNTVRSAKIKYNLD
jgi:methylenetetrahydrofolate dehydrogenase (NADP+)/methenyltetrahydrofolate cyclohydrolase